MTQTVTREIKSYSISCYGRGKKVTRPYPFRAIVSLWDASGMIGALYFHNDPNTMPDADYLPDTGQPISHYPIEDFARSSTCSETRSRYIINSLATGPRWPGSGLAWSRLARESPPRTTAY